MEDLITINEEKLDKLVLDIYDYSERTKNILNQISSIMYESNKEFDCSSMKKIYRKFSSLDNSMKNISSNIASYADDLLAVKRKFKGNASVISSEVNRQASNLQDIQS